MAPLDELRFCRRHARSMIALSTLLTPLVWSGAVGGGQAVASQETLPTLEAGKTIESQLSGGEAHAFQITLAQGQRLRVVVDQQGIDVTIIISTLQGHELVEMDSLTSTQGPEKASIIAEQAESYRVEILSSSKSVPAGRYEVRVEVAGVATEQDRQWIEAQQAYTEGGRLSAKPTAEAQTQAIRRFEKALGQWQALGDKLMTAHTLYYLARSHRRCWKLLLSLLLFVLLRAICLNKWEAG